MLLGYYRRVENHENDWRRVLWANTVGGVDEEIDLALASFVFASDRYPDLDIAQQMDSVERLARGATGWVPVDAGPRAALEGLARYLHGEQGFDGRAQAYHSTDGCFLNRAIESRTGLPITLSVIYLEVGWRLGLPLSGVGMPGHFIIKHEGPEELYCDPFHSGRILTAEECPQLVESVLGGRVAFRREFLVAVRRRTVLYRMLNNLKSMYLRSRAPELALWATDRMLLLEPDSPQEMRDRGLLHFATGRYTRAVGDLVLYLALKPPPPDAELITRHLHASQQRAGMLN